MAGIFWCGYVKSIFGNWSSLTALLPFLDLRFITKHLHFSSSESLHNPQTILSIFPFSQSNSQSLHQNLPSSHPLPCSFDELDWRSPVKAFRYLEFGERSAEAALRKGPAVLTQWPKEAFADKMVVLWSLCGGSQTKSTRIFGHKTRNPSSLRSSSESTQSTASWPNVIWQRDSPPK